MVPLANADPKLVVLNVRHGYPACIQSTGILDRRQQPLSFVSYAMLMLGSALLIGVRGSAAVFGLAYVSYTFDRIYI
jgi:hypothetical protein